MHDFEFGDRKHGQLARAGLTHPFQFELFGGLIPTPAAGILPISPPDSGSYHRVFGFIHRLRSRILNAVRHVGERIQQMLKPDTVSLLAGAAKDAVRSKTQLIAENALLRHQLIILQRQVKHPQLSNRDRLRLLLLARATPFWKQALLIVQPDTLLRWHRQLFRLVWRRSSKPKMPQSRITPETIALIRQMRMENVTWGAERIRGELLKLGIKVSKRTIQRYLPPETAPSTSPSNQNWVLPLDVVGNSSWLCRGAPTLCTTQ